MTHIAKGWAAWHPTKGFDAYHYEGAVAYADPHDDLLEIVADLNETDGTTTHDGWRIVLIDISVAKPIRIQLGRIKGWRMPPNTVRVARPGKFGNPFRCGPELRAISNAEKVSLFREAIERCGGFYSIGDEHCGKPMVTIADIRRELRGKNLACWCRLDEPCHADVLLEIAKSEDPA